MAKSKEELEMLIDSTRTIIINHAKSFATDYNDESYVKTIKRYCNKLLKYQAKWRELNKN